MNVYDLSSIAGVIALTTFAVSAIKAALKDVPWVNKIPVFIISLIVACLLCLLARSAGYLTGSMGMLIAQTVLGAVGAGGTYTVVSGSAMQTIEHAAKDPATIGDQSVIRPPVVMPIEAKKAATKPVSQTPGIDPGGKPPHLLSILLPLFLIPFATGCGTSSAQRAYTAAKTYEITLQTVRDLRNEGVIPQDAVDASKPYRVAAKAALVAWRQAAESNQQAAADTAEAKFLSAVQFLQTLVDEYTKVPTTRPTLRGAAHGSRGSTERYSRFDEARPSGGGSKQAYRQGGVGRYVCWDRRSGRGAGQPV